MWTLLLACLVMAAKDCIYTWLTIAQARGRALLAGALDALGDLASIAVILVGAGPVLNHGLTGHAIAVIGSMLVVSFFGTILWTKLGNRIGVPDAGVSN